MLHKRAVGRPPDEKEYQSLFSSFLLRGLTADERAKLPGLVAPVVCTYTAGTPIVEAGDAFRAVGIVTGGTLSVTRAGERRRVIHRTLTAGDAFGVSSLFGEEERFPTTVRAEEEATVLFLGEEELEALFAALPRTALNYVRLLTEKIRFLNDRLDTLAGRSAEERVAAHLLSHIGEDGALGITKSALASLLGLGRASLYRILDGFEAQGLIRAHRDRIEVLDAGGLNTIIKNRKDS